MILTDFSDTKHQIKIKGDDEVLRQLSQLGRTEDLHLSPNGNKLAIAGYVLNEIYIFELRNSEKSNKQIHLNCFLRIQSPDLKNPHGVFWLDDSTIAVANREDATCIFKLPKKFTKKNYLISLNPISKINCDNIDHLMTSSCICADTSQTGLNELLICSNYAHYVTHHLLDANYAVIGSATLLKDGLNVPDGVAISANKKWISISNHDDHTIFVYQNHIELNPQSKPNAVLHGVGYPHGIKFFGNDHYIFVTDAGSPFVFIFFNPSPNWQGKFYPCSKIKIMNDKMFNRCHTSHQEGGNKGLYIDDKRGLLMISCEQIPLACFDINIIINQLKNKTTHENISFSLLDDKDKLMRIAKNIRTDSLRNKTHFEEQLNTLKNTINDLLESKSWKITSVLRFINHLLKKQFSNTD